MCWAADIAGTCSGWVGSGGTEVTEQGYLKDATLKTSIFCAKQLMFCDRGRKHAAV
jgi:hypothetical protein